MVFADEPTGNLDPTSAGAVLSMLREQAQAGACIILVTHDPAIAGAADHRIGLPPLVPAGSPDLLPAAGRRP